MKDLQSTEDLIRFLENRQEVRSVRSIVDSNIILREFEPLLNTVGEDAHISRNDVVLLAASIIVLERQIRHLLNLLGHHNVY